MNPNGRRLRHRTPLVVHGVQCVLYTLLKAAKSQSGREAVDAARFQLTLIRP